jgi:hypothetical protein
MAWQQADRQALTCPLARMAVFMSSVIWSFDALAVPGKRKQKNPPCCRD